MQSFLNPSVKLSGMVSDKCCKTVKHPTVMFFLGQRVKEKCQGKAYLGPQVVQYCMQHYCHATASGDFPGLGHVSRSNSHVDGEHVFLVQYIVLKQDSSEKKKIFRFANRFHLIFGIVADLHSVYQELAFKLVSVQNHFLLDEFPVCKN